MTTTLKCNEPLDLLRAAPQLAGGTPSQSALILPFHGTRASCAMRIDLPEPAEEGEWADAVLRLTTEVGADRAAIIIYVDDRLDFADLPFRSLIRAVRRSSRSWPVEITETLVVGADRWSDYREPERRGRRFEIGDATPFRAGVEGVPLRPSAAREEQLCSLHAEAASRGGPDAADAPGLAEALVQLGPDALTDDLAIELQALAQVPGVRDGILIALALGADEGALAAAASLAPADHFARVEQDAAFVMGLTGAPDAARLRRARDAWAAVCSRTPEQMLAPVLAIQAWLEWASGRNSVADASIAAAIAADAQSGFARIIRSLLHQGHFPVWITRSMSEVPTSGGRRGRTPVTKGRR